MDTECHASIVFKNLKIIKAKNLKKKTIVECANTVLMQNVQIVLMKINMWPI